MTLQTALKNFQKGSTDIPNHLYLSMEHRYRQSWRQSNVQQAVAASFGMLRYDACYEIRGLSIRRKSIGQRGLFRFTTDL